MALFDADPIAAPAGVVRRASGSAGSIARRDRGASSCSALLPAPVRDRAARTRLRHPRRGASIDGEEVPLIEIPDARDLPHRRRAQPAHRLRRRAPGIRPRTGSRSLRLVRPQPLGRAGRGHLPDGRTQRSRSRRSRTPPRWSTRSRTRSPRRSSSSATTSRARSSSRASSRTRRPRACSRTGDMI